jgi:hypothetical protein
LGENADRATIDCSVASDDGITKRAALFLAKVCGLMACQSVNLLKGVFVKEHFDALHGREFPAGMLLSDGLLLTARGLSLKAGQNCTSTCGGVAVWCGLIFCCGAHLPSLRDTLVA